MAKSVNQDKLNTFFEKYKIPLISTLSILAIVIIAITAIVISSPSRENTPENNKNPNTPVANEPELTETQKAINDQLVAATANTENSSPETTQEAIQNLSNIISNEETTTADRVLATRSLATIYRRESDNASAINQLESALTDKNLDNEQKVNLLSDLNTIYIALKSPESQIAVLERILAVPPDASYSREMKTDMDQYCQKTIEELKNVQ